MDATAVSARARAGLLLTALGVWALYLYLNFPGYMSHDSAHQYWQVRHAQHNDMHSVWMQLVWTVTEQIWPGPGGQFVLFSGTFILAMLWFCWQLKAPAWVRWLILLGLTLLPYNLMIVPHVWKDVGLLGMVMLGVCALLTAVHRQRSGFIWLGLWFFWLAVLYRFNAVLMLWPLMLWACVHLARLQGWGRAQAATLALLYLLITALSPRLLSWTVGAEHKVLWPTVAIWDIASVSQRERQLLLPEFMLGPGFNLQDIDEANQPWSNTPLLHGTQHGIRSALIEPYSAEQNRLLARRWLSLPLRHTGAYLSHRWALTRHLLGLEDSEPLPRALMFHRGIAAHRDNPPMAMNQSRAGRALFDWLGKNPGQFLLSGWFYLVLSLVALAVPLVCKRNRTSPVRQLTLMVAISAVMSLLSLAMMAPAAESRYLVVLVNLSCMGLILGVSFCRHGRDSGA